MSSRNYVIRNKHTRWFLAHIDFPGPYTELLQQARTFELCNSAEAVITNPDDYVEAIDDILPFPDDSV